jgi:hypothetical protein
MFTGAYGELARRRGKNIATVAIARRLLARSFWAHPLLEQLRGLGDQGSSVSSSLIRRLAAASSPRSLVEVPGLTPRSMRSWAFHRYTVASASPNSAATTRTGRPARTSSTTRRRNSGS